MAAAISEITIKPIIGHAPYTVETVSLKAVFAAPDNFMAQNTDSVFAVTVSPMAEPTATVMQATMIAITAIC